MRITTHQLRAARGLLDWTQDDLAREARVGVATIRKFELGIHSVQAATEDALWRALSPYVEFNGTSGVALRDDALKRLGGPDCYLRLLDDVMETLVNAPRAEALFACVDDSVSSPEVVAANNRIRNAGIRCRYLCSAAATRLDYPLRDYRALPARFFSNGVRVIYADKLAMLKHDGQSGVIIRDKDLAAAERGQFEFIWLQAAMPKVDV